ncbi:AAA-domain-containing protein [Choiromyces venosus 120613-1]|uniref:Vesicular-fusion protein SEC18 n=1 Tax=Choiromyces venosus 120613-1 TaxID=1336337 RepID=A0A3N4KA56_9PEZI|nr:AAA-domain-containing protein [Choiromyces venosus 120613-1]
MSGHGPKRFMVLKSPEEFVSKKLFNIVAVSPQDFPIGQYVICNDTYILRVRPADAIVSGSAGFSSTLRKWVDREAGESITIAPFDQFRAPRLVSLDLGIGFALKKTSDETYDQDELIRLFIQNFEGQIFAPGQLAIMDIRNIKLEIEVKAVQIAQDTDEKSVLPSDAPKSKNPAHHGILKPHTGITFYEAAKSPIKIKHKRSAANAIIRPDFKFEDMGIGGLDTEFSQIFRRAFASRVISHEQVERLGIQHVKGILLFGPPGTGKTLIARQIGKMLRAREPKVVNGPEILNKYVGQSEENIRKLFADAEKEYKEKAEESGLHIIIFDELDAICKQRGSKNDGTGVGDSVVNQLLSKLDGVDQLNNILVIGMTNRMDMIDEALLRPGRLEVHMEISLPDEAGRHQILKIHTNKMRENEAIDPDVNIQELAEKTKNFSGAEIGGLVKSASSFAFNRHVKVETNSQVETVAGMKDVENIKVNRQDFFNALQEVRPAFGVSEEELEQAVQGGIIRYSENINSILAEGHLFVEQVRKSERTLLVSVLMHGPPGSGKTALAASIAKASEFPFIKLVSPEAMVGFNEMSKVSYLSKVFMDAYKSPLNVVIVDNVERILEFVPIGPRFSNPVLQTLLVLLRKQPPLGRRLLIIATTTERSVLAQMDLLNAFDADIAVPNVANHDELKHILRELKAFNSDEERADVLARLRDTTLTPQLNVGIKKIVMGVETARQDKDMSGRFVNVISRAVVENGADLQGGDPRLY